jgi:TPP-dependent pyruvate/acetoin dehydrogenase alpha subunit
VVGRIQRTADFERALKDAEAIVAESVEFAEKSPEPGLDTMYDQIYTQPVPNMQVGGSLIRPAKVASGANGTH